VFLDRIRGARSKWNNVLNIAKDYSVLKNTLIFRCGLYCVLVAVNLFVWNSLYLFVYDWI